LHRNTSIAAEDAVRGQLVRTEFEIAGDIEIQVAITIVICERRCRTPTRNFGIRLAAELPKRTIALVQIEPVPTVIRDMEIIEAVLVDVARNRAHSPALIAEAGFSGDVNELSIFVIAIQPVAGGVLPGLLGLHRRSIY
jgi:hypothetical protein